MNEAERVEREQTFQAQVQKLRTGLGITVCTAVMIILALTVYALKDVIAADNLVLLPVVWFSMLHFVFSCYSVYVCLATDIVPETRKSGKLLWWHGAAVVGTLLLSVVGGAVVLVVKFLLGLS